MTNTELQLWHSVISQIEYLKENKPVTSTISRTTWHTFKLTKLHSVVLQTDFYHLQQTSDSMHLLNVFAETSATSLPSCCTALSKRSLQKMQIYAVWLIKMHLAKNENTQQALMRSIIILKLPFVVCVSSVQGVMKWLWHFIRDSCGDETVCRWFSFSTGISEQLFYLILSYAAPLSLNRNTVMGSVWKLCPLFLQQYV